MRLKLRHSWRKIIAIHLIYSGLGIALFAPLLGLLGQLTLALSGKPALADMDLLYFALTPPGILSLVLFGSFLIVIAIFELASLMAVCIQGEQQGGKEVLGALLFSLRRVKPILITALKLLLKFLVVALPFLVAASAVTFLLLSDYDINYYLSIRPPVFWLAVVLSGLLLSIMVYLLSRQLVAWSLVLPLVLFTDRTSKQAFADSERLSTPAKRRIFFVLLSWGLTSLAMSAVLAFLLQWFSAILVPLFLHSLELLALVLGLITLTWLVSNTLLAALIIGCLAFLLAQLTITCEPNIKIAWLDTPEKNQILLKKMSLAKLLILLASVITSTVFIGITLLNDVDLNDKAVVIAHRGASGAAPENTMASIRRAIKDGADWIEIDVQETVDGQIVVVHDSDFMKLAGIKLKVWEATLAEIQQIDVGSWFSAEFAGEQVPTLAEVLEEVRGKSRLIIELKYYGHDEQLEQRVVDLIEKAAMQHDIRIMSLDYAGLQKIRKLRPDWMMGLLSAKAIGDLTQLDTDFLAVNTGLATSALIHSARNSGKEVYVWTINDALSMSHMMSLGVDGVITDDPKLARSVLMTRAELSPVERLLLNTTFLFGQSIPNIPELRVYETALSE